MQTLLQLLSVFLLSAFELYAAVPAGLALGLSPFLVWLATVAGALVSVVVVVLAGERLRPWLIARLGRGRAREGGRVRGIWERYGVIGWGLVGPLLLGAPLSAALGVALGAPRGRLLFWLGAGVGLWVTILTLAAVLGVGAVRNLGR
jgi:hypothetical protein